MVHPPARHLLYEAGTVRGYAYFFPDGTPLAPAVIDAVNGAIHVHFNLSQLSGVLQLLRAEPDGA